MPIFFQHQINAGIRLGIWKIEETEGFFKANVPLHRDVTHPHKRLQHLAGRFLLQYLFPAFPYELIEIADTRRPYLPGEQYHFSISHCGDYAAAIVSKDRRAGIDIEIPVEKIMRIRDKFLSGKERNVPVITGRAPGSYPATSEEDWRPLTPGSERLASDLYLTTLLWSAKEAVFKWHGQGRVDFSRHIQLERLHADAGTIDCFFSKSRSHLTVHYHLFDQLVLAWVIS